MKNYKKAYKHRRNNVNLPSCYMKKFINSLLPIFFVSSPVLTVDPEIKEWTTYSPMLCMLSGECKDGIDGIHGFTESLKLYLDPRARLIKDEFDELIRLLNMVGVKVYIGDSKYFPFGHRGVYHTVSNNLFLNKKYLDQPAVMITLIRHEGWHVVQDCMAGTIDNPLIALVHEEEDIPEIWQDIGASTYGKESLLWEQEALWAGHTKDKTVQGLRACLTGRMWDVFLPTALTKKYLVEEGYLKDRPFATLPSTGKLLK